MHYGAKRLSELTIYHIQTKLQTHLPDDLKHDIHSNMEKAVQEANEWEENYKQAYDEILKKKFPFKWNELRIRLARMKTPAADEVLEFMHMLDDDISIR